MTDKRSTKLTVTIEVPDERIEGLIMTAVEYGSGYWCTLVKWDSGGTIIGVYTFEDNEIDRGLLVLDDEAMRRGLQVMADKAPRHLADIMHGRDCAITADVYLQCCLLGDVLYG